MLGVGNTIIDSDTIEYETSYTEHSDNENIETVSEDVEAVSEETEVAIAPVSDITDITSLPEYSNQAYIEINNNIPTFMADEITTTSYESYAYLDALGRVGVAKACIGMDLMPTEERGSISEVYPTGWEQASYDNVDGGWLYNRSHLIGWQLTGEDANEYNLMTGTRYMNVEGMLPFENMVADYIKETENHVMYRVTPHFIENNLLASGVQIEAYSVEDDGAGISFNVYCYNVQPDITIDYTTGSSVASIENMSSNTEIDQEIDQDSEAVIEEEEEVSTEICTYVLNTSTMKFHDSSCGSVDSISEDNKSTFTGTREEVMAQGYLPCGNCNP